MQDIQMDCDLRADEMLQNGRKRKDAHSEVGAFQFCALPSFTE